MKEKKKTFAAAMREPMLCWAIERSGPVRKWRWSKLRVDLVEKMKEKNNWSYDFWGWNCYQWTKKKQV